MTLIAPNWRKTSAHRTFESSAQKCSDNRIFTSWNVLLAGSEYPRDSLYRFSFAIDGPARAASARSGRRNDRAATSTHAKERRMTETTNSLSDLIEISEDGTAFYEEAAQKVKDKKLSALFARLAKAKSDLAQELSGEVKPVAGKKKPVKKGANSLG